MNVPGEVCGAKSNLCPWLAGGEARSWLWLASGEDTAAPASDVTGRDIIILNVCEGSLLADGLLVVYFLMFESWITL